MSRIVWNLQVKPTWSCLASKLSLDYIQSTCPSVWRQMFRIHKPSCFQIGVLWYYNFGRKGAHFLSNQGHFLRYAIAWWRSEYSALCSDSLYWSPMWRSLPGWNISDEVCVVFVIHSQINAVLSLYKIIWFYQLDWQRDLISSERIRRLFVTVLLFENAKPELILYFLKLGRFKYFSSVSLIR